MAGELKIYNIRTGFVEPYGQQSEHGRATDCRKETSPVVSHCEVHGCYFDAEEHTAYRSSEAARNSDRTRCSQHFSVSRFVLVDSFERSDYFRQKRGRYTGNVHERTLKFVAYKIK